jgi:hypothetical protein
MSWSLALLWFTAGQAQYPMVVADKEKVPATLPADAKRLPRERAEAAPEELYQKILGDGEKIVDVRLLALNMDTDDAVERILMRGTADAEVFKREKGVWWKLANLGWAAPTPGHTEIEVRETVFHGVNDIVMKTGYSAGTGVGGSSIQIYRIWQGHLYEVLKIADQYDYSFETTSRLHFGGPDRQYSLRSTRTKTYFDGGMGMPRPPGTPRVSSICTEFAFDAVKFRFAAKRTVAGACKPD